MPAARGSWRVLTFESLEDFSQYPHHHQSRPTSSWTQAIIVVVLTGLLIYLLRPNKIMDLLDAYMELPYSSIIFHR
jgi:hypothetical protein